MSKRAIISMAAFVWVFTKLPQEWWIHIAQLDFTEFMVDHPSMWLVLGAVAITAAVVV